MTIIDNGSVTSAKGFTAAGVTCGLKKSGKADLALIFSETPCRFSAAFTANQMAAAPVKYCRELCTRSAAVHAIVVNSGNANACTGNSGDQASHTMGVATAKQLGIGADQVLVSSTGRIGINLPIDKITAGIKVAAQSLSVNGGLDAAKAIMTTDTVPKSLAVSIDIGDRIVTIGGIAKGAGMIAPKLESAHPHATMLAYITTDADVEIEFLHSCLAKGLDGSFNRITVDGDMSTNDTVVVLANGQAQNQLINAETDAGGEFATALDYVMTELARMMVRDGEGATKFVEVCVRGANSCDDARAAASAIANSALCKTAWFGEDPNWGRITAALGYSGVDLIADNVDIYYDDVPVFRGGIDAGTEIDKLEDVLKNDEFVVTVDLGLGDATFSYWTCDLSYDYVKINGEYRT